MKIDEIDSKKLLPNWAHDADWIQAAFDGLVKACVARIPAIDAPLTLEAIKCLTDAEIEAWFGRFGVVEYYPELSRTTRENMLYWLARLYRFLGTPNAVRVLCNYIFDELPLDPEVRDNLAFDGETLVDPALLDLFDLVIDAGTSEVSPAQVPRIMANIYRIVRNSQTLRATVFSYAAEIDIDAAPAPCGAQCTTCVADSAPATLPPYVDVDLWFNVSLSGVTFDAGEFYGSIITWTKTRTQLSAYSVPLLGIYGEPALRKIDNLALESFILVPVALYANAGVDTAINDLHAPMSNFFTATNLGNGANYGQSINIHAIDAYGELAKMWRCRIVPVDTEIKTAYINGGATSVSPTKMLNNIKDGSASGPQLTFELGDCYEVVRMYSSATDTEGFYFPCTITRVTTGISRAALTNVYNAAFTVHHFSYRKVPARRFQWSVSYVSGKAVLHVTLSDGFTGRVCVRGIAKTGATNATKIFGTFEATNGRFDVQTDITQTSAVSTLFINIY